MNKANEIPLISIIMTTYNGAAFIEATIESVRNQTWQEWELIVVDDGSDDTTCALISVIGDDRIHLYKAGRTGINGKLKNSGLSMAKGSLIAFIDHDDLWAGDKLEKQVAALRQYPEAGFCICGGYNFKDTGVPGEFFMSRREGSWKGNIFLSLFRSEISGWTQAILLRKECINVAGQFNENYRFADPEFIYRLAWHFEAVVLYEPLFFHRIHESNYTKVQREDSHAEGIAVIRECHKKNMLPAAMTKDALFRSYIHFGEKCIQYKKRATAIGSFFRAWQQKPFSIVPFKKTGKAILSYLQ
jgi:glycosyltransferase involved in cell wall biosynthesis